jgi:Beta propeller domain
VAATGLAAAALVTVTLGPSGPNSSRPGIAPYRLTGALVSFDGCGDYLQYVKQRAKQLIGPYGLTDPGLLYAKGAFGLPVPDADFHGSTLRSIEQFSDDLSSPVAHSTTTNQVAAVDEPDTVKTDGRLVVTLTGSMLRVLDTEAHVLGSVRVDGDTGGGLLLVGDRAVVLSSVGADVAPSWFGAGLVGHPRMTPTATARAAVVDLSQPNRPRLLRSFLFDGSAVAARLVDGHVRLALRSDAPRLEFQTPSASVSERAATAENRRLVATSSLDDWLPAWQVQAPDGSTTARHPLASCDAVARPRHASGLSTVSVVTLDPAASAPQPATSVVAAGETVYATSDRLYVAGLSAPAQSRKQSRRLGPCCGYRIDRLLTRIYAFATAGDDRPRFVGAGSVPGALLDSYSMDEDTAGRLRVASTTRDRHGRTDSRITVLSVTRHTFTAIGTVDRLGHGQQLHAVRFLGDTAYVVTFRSYDPLYVVDLRDPAHPHVAGRLEQPGYSEFLYPLGAGRLVGVGVHLHHGEPSRLVLSTYDVTDPTHPRRIDSATLAHGFQASSGMFDPHAFLSWPPTSLVVVAVPNGRGAVAYRVRTGGKMSRLATLTHGRLSPTRTLVVGGNVWAVTPNGVLVSPLPTLEKSDWHAYG